MLSVLRCVLCCQDEPDTGELDSECLPFYAVCFAIKMYNTLNIPDHSNNNYHAIPDDDDNNNDSFSRTMLSNSYPSALTAPRTQNFPTSNHFPQKFKTPFVYNHPKHTLAASSSFSSTFGESPRSRKFPSVINKAVLVRAVSDSTSQQTKGRYNVVEKGSTPLYVIPEDIKALIRQDIVPGILKKPLSPQTYKDYFAALLYAEDYYLEKWDGFEMKNVILKLHEAEIHGRNDMFGIRNNHQRDDKIFVEFELDSIPEKRPFLLSRDFASVRPCGRKVDPFQGIIFRVVKSNIVLVEFGDDFHAQYHSSCKYDVKFSFNRVCLKRAHQAIAAASDMLFMKFLFPDCWPKYISFYTTAISRIISLSGPPAYLVEGPLSVTRDKKLSRTGMVVRDAVVQLCQAPSHNKILICAPLNSTCDVFMRSLRKEVGDSNIFRANAASRELDNVPVDILPFCPYKEKDEVFSCPSLSQLLKFKVILSTYMSSFRLHNEGIEGGNFSHIFLVDASSAIEPEIMVPLTNLTSESTKVVVTGSPGNQSCWVRSNIARQNGLRTSYFERLRKSKAYRDINPEYITRLEDDSSSSSSYFSLQAWAFLIIFFKYDQKWNGFEMENVTLKINEAEIYGRKGKSKNKNNDKRDEKIFVEFEVDSIPEKRPYLLSRDFASVRPTGRKVDPFQGIIFRVVRSNIVLVEFGEDFHAQHYPSCNYDVKFSFNRVCLKRAHEAIATASDMLFKKFLFPDCMPKKSYISEKEIFAEKLLFSRHKVDPVAISRIINLDGPPAYLLEGPLSVTDEKQLSRTGMVVRDAVVQLCEASLHSRILICAPTNSTCDVFMRSLQKEVGYSEIFRANAAFRELDGVPIDILPFCPYIYKEKAEVFTCPSLSQLRNFKVILSTFMSSFRLHNEGIEGGHFTHIILVDASSVTEPEILVPLTNLTNASTKVVVTGVPGYQLCYVRSDIARQNGLGTSYFERLRKSKLYRDRNPESITQLNDNSSSSSSYFR